MFRLLPAERAPDRLRCRTATLGCDSRLAGRYLDGMAPHIKIELNDRQYAELNRRAVEEGVTDPSVYLEEHVTRWLNRKPEAEIRASDDVIRIELRARGGIVAKALFLPDGQCIVAKGSKAARSVSQYFDKVKRHAECREALIRSSTIVETGVKEPLEFARDYRFESVALATAVVLGYRTEGPSRWSVEGGQKGVRLSHLLAYRRTPSV
jgi:hypothetical protein